MLNGILNLDFHRAESFVFWCFLLKNIESVTYFRSVLEICDGGKGVKIVKWHNLWMAP